MMKMSSPQIPIVKPQNIYVRRVVRNEVIEMQTETGRAQERFVADLPGRN